MDRESSVMMAIARNANEIRRYIGDVFRVLPDRTSYPDYYETIPEPESLDNISVSCSVHRSHELIIGWTWQTDLR
jgi:hypothetical protein